MECCGVAALRGQPAVWVWAVARVDAALPGKARVRY